MDSSSVFVIVVNYRTGPLVVECLASIEPELMSLRGGRVIVVDNDSQDGSVAHISAVIQARGWGEWAEVIALPRNGGFAYGNNRAIQRLRELDPEYGFVVCLNPDATILPGAIGHLIDDLEQHPDAGAAGAAIEDPQGHERRSEHPFPSPLSELDYGAQLGLLTRMIGAASMLRTRSQNPGTCDWVSGACFAVRARLIEEMGFLDEGYFLYYEETDFCLRARRAGWTCRFVPAARIRHVEGASTGILSARSRRQSYWFASRRRFFTRAYGISGLVAADLLWALGRASFVLRRTIGLGGAPKDQPEPERFAVDLLVGDARAILKGELRRLKVITPSSP